jgi:hypothetical protein
MMSLVLYEIAAERTEQYRKWGEQNHPSGTGPRRLMPISDSSFSRMRDSARKHCQHRHDAGRGTWLDILMEEFFEYAAESDPAREREELIQLAACCVARVEHIDRGNVVQA